MRKVYNTQIDVSAVSQPVCWSVALRASTALLAFWFRVYFCTVDIWLLLIRSWFGDLSASDRPRLARGEANERAKQEKIKAPQGPDSEGKLDLRERVV